MSTPGSSRRVAMARLAPDVAVRSFAEVAAGYAKVEAIAEAQRAIGFDLAGARTKCPFDVDIPELTRLIACGDFEGAYLTVVKAHPWPGILGRACHRECEAHASTTGAEPLFISALERAAADHGGADDPPFTPAPATGKRIAVLGAGSAASAVAYGLRRRGNEVAMFDRLPVGGGMMTIGYPDFRLPHAVVHRDNSLSRWGVQIYFGVALTRERVTELLAQYDAVVAATGKFEGAPLEIPGRELAGTYDALDYLTRFKTGDPIALGDRIVVIGAGYAAMDVSRTARRLGHDVTIYYRRSKAEMPVDQSRVEMYVATLAGEGVRYVFHAAPVCVLGEQGRVVAVEFVRTATGPSAESGRPIPVPVAGSKFIVPCDSVIAAIGEVCDLSFLPQEVRQTDDGHVWVDPGTFRTTVDGLYAVGEMTGAKGTATAFAAGLACAEVVHRNLAGSAGPTAP